MIRVDQQMLRVTHYMFFEERAAFAPISRHMFPRPGKAFVEGAMEGADVVPVETL